MDGTLRCARAIFQNGVHFQSCRPNAGFSEAPASDQHRHLWCFGDCRPLLDGNTVQIFISNYAIPSGYKPHSFGMPPEIQQLGPPLPDFSNVKFLPPRTDPFGLHRQAFPHQQKPESRFGRRKIREREYPSFGQPSHSRYGRTYRVANSRFHYPLPATTKVSKSIFGLAFHVRRNGEQASGQPIAARSVR